MKNLLLTVYDKDGNPIKTAVAQMVKLEFGTVRTLMRILKVDSMESTFDVLSTLAEAWEQVEEVLTKIFPELTDEDFEHVRVDELLPVVLGILGYSFAELLNIPREDSKN